MVKMVKKTLDARVSKMMADVKERRANIETLRKPSWLTSCSLVLPGFERINIQVTTDLALLAIAIGTLSRMKADATVVMDDLEIDIPLNWQNYVFEDWITDIKLRIKTTQIQTEQAKLSRLEKQLQPLLSDNQRREMALADIEAEMA